MNKQGITRRLYLKINKTLADAISLWSKHSGMVHHKACNISLDSIQPIRSNWAMLLCGNDYHFNLKHSVCCWTETPPNNSVQKSSTHKVHSPCVMMHWLSEDVEIGVVNNASSCRVKPSGAKTSAKRSQKDLLSENVPWNLQSLGTRNYKRSPFRKYSVHTRALLVLKYKE